MVATGGALVAFTPAGAQSGEEPLASDEAPPEVTVDVDEPDLDDPIEISPECMALIEVERIAFELDDEDLGAALTDEDLAEMQEFAAAARAHLDQAGISYELMEEMGVEFPEPVDDAGWDELDAFAEEYFESGFDDLDDLEFEEVDDIELPQALVDFLNEEDEALRDHLDAQGVEYTTEIDEQGVSFTMPVNDDEWSSVDEFYDARYGDCEEALEAEFGVLGDGCDDDLYEDDDEDDDVDTDLDGEEVPAAA